ncbi:MAG: hypothetical protein K0S83_134, partial [Thermomicrobiales bacterium]|nr:hypothetical protein [Thermomicrobiales bacterium]
LESPLEADGISVRQRRPDAGLGNDLSNAAAHSPRADDKDSFDCRGLRVRRRLPYIQRPSLPRIRQLTLARLYVPRPLGTCGPLDSAFFNRRRRSILRFRGTIAAIHRADDAVPLPFLHTAGRCFEHGWEESFFLGSEAGQHLSRGMPGSAADPDSHSGECVNPQLLDDRLETIMPAGASPGTEPHGTERQVDVVHDNKHVGERGLIPVHGFPHREPAQVHVRPRLEQHDFFSIIENFDKVGAKAVASFTRGMTPNELVDDHETEVVPCRGVLSARVPQTHDDLHNQDASQATAARSRCYTPAAILPRQLIL